MIDDEDEPRIYGTNVTVLDVYRSHAREGLEPVEVAHRYDVPLAHVHEAIAYYYDHSAEMQELERPAPTDYDPSSASRLSDDEARELSKLSG